FCKKAGVVLFGHNVIFITFVLLGEGKCFFSPLLRKAPPLPAIHSKHFAKDLKRFKKRSKL
ncbi:hypothetical protein, partial [Riemerella anatipestifer]|uniref:hypothetical protein n=1 Tax=Riemerella anatipestifer TaxID=34085 RepID=UPI00236446C2